MTQSKNSKSILPNIRGRRLFASLPEQQAQQTQKAEALTQYRRKYWQGYKKKIRRIFGTLSIAEYQFWKIRADHNRRPVWQEVYSSACAYVQRRALPTAEIIKEQEKLRAELLRIGNNLNQAVRLGHIKANHGNRLYAEPGDQVGQFVLKGMQDLERRVCRFEADVTALVSSASSDANR